MKKRKIKILGYVLYILISIGLLVLLFTIRDQYNWIASSLRTLFTYLLISLTIIFSGVSIITYLKSKKRKIITLGIIGLIPCLIAIPFLKSPVYKEKKSLNDNIETIELTYIAWACDCANWAKNEDLEKYSENINNALAKQSIFIEPANETIELPDTLGYSNDIIKFTGQFYNEKGFPKGFYSFQKPEKSRVFRYTEFEVIESNFKNYRDLKNKNE